MLLSKVWLRVGWGFSLGLLGGGVGDEGCILLNEGCSGFPLFRDQVSGRGGLHLEEIEYEILGNYILRGRIAHAPIDEENQIRLVKEVINFCG